MLTSIEGPGSKGPSNLKNTVLSASEPRLVLPSHHGPRSAGSDPARTPRVRPGALQGRSAEVRARKPGRLQLHGHRQFHRAPTQDDVRHLPEQLAGKRLSSLYY